MRRGVAFSADVAEAICERLAQGDKYIEIAESTGMPSHYTMSIWRRRRPDFRARTDAAMMAAVSKAEPTAWRADPLADLTRAALRHALGLQVVQAAMLEVLFGAGGAPLKRRDICTRVDSHRPPTLQAFYERVRSLRERLGEGVIDSRQLRIQGHAGEAMYWLTPAGIAMCHDAVKRAAGLLIDLTEAQRAAA